MPYLGNPMPTLLWCPSDRPLAQFYRAPSAWLPGLYKFSYGLNAPAGPEAFARRPVWPGMASSIPSTPGGGSSTGLGGGQGSPYLDPEKLFYFKSVSIRSPSRKILFADKAMAHEPAEGERTAGGNSSAWYWPTDKVTQRHNGKGNVTMADGSVSTVRPEFAVRREHYDPLH